MNFSRLLVRVVVGALFVGHGTQKLFGILGGPGLEGTQQMMTGLQLHPAKRNAVAAGAAETVGGSLLLTGLATPLASASLIGAMITAIRKVHWRNGIWSANGGYEYNLMLIAALLALTESGPGPVSLDQQLGIATKGPKWALFSLLLGASASTAVIELGRRHPDARAAAQVPMP
jgi:putative oxidoreductase